MLTLSLGSAKRKVLCALAALAVANAAALTRADLTDVVFKIEARGSQGAGSYELTMADVGWQSGAEQWDYRGSESIVIRDASGQELASLSNVEMFFRADPQISMSFAVQAGSSDTIFTITSSLLSFPTLNNADGQASAAFTVTDVNGDGAVLTGQYPTGGGNVGFAANYNGGTLFSGMILGLSVASGTQSASTAENDPVVGYRSVGANVSNMQSVISFQLSAGDLASGTTSYEIVPEPGTLVLLGLGVVGFLRRKF